MLIAIVACLGVFGDRQGVLRPIHDASVTLLTVSDLNSLAKQALQRATIRSYAAYHGYSFHVLEPRVHAPACASMHHNFFFMKHCAVQMYMRTIRQDAVLFVLDGDVVVSSMETSLSRWMDDPADIQFYERSWNFEVTAGAYMVRNTPLGRHFLAVWSNFEFVSRTLSGFHSSDNGAIHLVLLRVLSPLLPAFTSCTQQYLRLSSPSLTPYFKFVACTRRVMGPPRHWDVPGPVKGKISVYPRYHGFMVDGYLFSHKTGGRTPLYHGYKDVAATQKIFHYEFKVGDKWRADRQAWDICASRACDLRMPAANAFASVNEHGKAASSLEKGWILDAKNQPFGAVPRISLVDCVQTFSCMEELESRPISALKEVSGWIH